VIGIDPRDLLGREQPRLDQAKIEVVRAFMDSDPAREMLLRATRQSSATSAA